MIGMKFHIKSDDYFSCGDDEMECECISEPFSSTYTHRGKSFNGHPTEEISSKVSIVVKYNSRREEKIVMREASLSELSIIQE